MAEWTFDTKSRRYRNLTTGRYLSAASSIELRDDAVVRLRRDTADLTRQLADREIAVQAWESAMQANVREVNVLQFAFGRGGRNAMTDTDRASLAEIIDGQNAYLRAFAQDVAAGQLSEAQITARAKLYYGSSVAAYERGRSGAFGVSLPAYPADGGTACKSACRCRWQLVDKGDEIHATWKLQAGESCSGCKRRASQWSPLVVVKSSDGRAARLFRLVA